MRGTPRVIHGEHQTKPAEFETGQKPRDDELERGRKEIHLTTKDESGTARASANTASLVRRRSPPRPEDESSAKRPRVADPTPPDPGGAQLPPHSAAPPSTSWESGTANRLFRAGGSFIVREAQSQRESWVNVVEFGHLPTAILSWTLRK